MSKLCNYDKQPCPARIEGKGPGESRCEQNGVCQRVDMNALPTLSITMTADLMQPCTTLPSNLIITPPQIRNGERWAGIVTTEKGLHHIILLPGDQDAAPWKKQMAWAKKTGGGLPDRVELATLRRALPDEFKPDWYWSGEQHAASPDCAWYQHFDTGGQLSLHITTKLRARAVRRVAILEFNHQRQIITTRALNAMLL